jgi:formate hydrogenlyase subunit 6/NADH:ubiquinone oxidoreductase subunit I
LDLGSDGVSTQIADQQEAPTHSGTISLDSDPDISEQMCIGCALCVEICTTLGPDVLRVKPVEGWKRGKAFVFYPERCISDGACIGVCPTKAIFWMRPMDFTVGQPVPLHKDSVFVKGWTELID